MALYSEKTVVFRYGQRLPATATCLWGSTTAYGSTVRGAQLDLACGGVPHLRAQALVGLPGFVGRGFGMAR